VEGVFVGVPHEDVGAAADAGMVVKILYGPRGRSTSTTYWTQDTPGMPGRAEAGDLLGAAVAETEKPSFAAGWGSAAFGAPGEDIGQIRDAGLVTFLNEAASFEDYGDLGEYYPGYAISENSRGVPGVAEAGDRFGAALDSVTYGCGVDSTGGYAIGVPGEDRGSISDTGRLVLFDSGYAGVEGVAGPGTSDPTCGPVSLQQGRGAPGTAEAGDRFGTQVARTPRGNLAISAPGEDRLSNTVKDAGVVDYVRMRPVEPISEETLVTGARAGSRYATLWTLR
jgi:hypothetical protein